jgi:hypothetical protein
VGFLLLRSSAGAAAPAPSVFPLEISSNGRYLQQADGTPFLITGDAGWMIPNQLTNAEIDAYLDAMEAVGVNAVLIECPGIYFTSQTPTYDNVDGEQPFTTMASVSSVDFASALVDAYWNRVDYLVNEAKARNMILVWEVAYLGFLGGQEGWADAVLNESDADLTTYGERLGARYTQGNILWCAGGDYNGSDGSLEKQWNILEGIISEQPDALIMAHNSPDTSGYATWNSFEGWNINTSYCYPDIGDVYPYEQCATEYGRAGPIPLFYLEGRYESETGYTDAIGRLQMYTPVLSGALCGFLIGNNPRWHFESPNAIYSYEGTFEDSYTSTLTQALAHAKALFEAYEWWKLEPKTDTSLVSSSLSSGLARLTPALASDATFAMIYVPSSQTVTVVTDALTGVAGTVRIRLYNPTDGTYSVNQASIAKSSGQSVATGGERIIVVDAA